MNSIFALDLRVFSLIYSFAGKSGAMDKVIVFFAEYYFYLIVLIVIVALAQSYRGNIQLFWKYMFAVGSAIVARFAVATVIRFIIPRERPFLALHIPHLLTDNASAFPSGHTIFMFALAMGVWFANRRFGWFLFASGIVIGIARVASAVHYPSDILGGIVFGILTTLILKALFDRFLVHKLA